jgi:hypothetical protein
MQSFYNRHDLIEEVEEVEEGSENEPDNPHPHPKIPASTKRDEAYISKIDHPCTNPSKAVLLDERREESSIVETDREPAEVVEPNSQDTNSQTQINRNKTPLTLRVESTTDSNLPLLY